MTLYYKKSALPANVVAKNLTSVIDFMQEIADHKKDVLVSGNAWGMLTSGDAVSQQFLTVFEPTNSHQHAAKGFLGTAYGCQLFTDAYAPATDTDRVFFGSYPQYILLDKTFDLPGVPMDETPYYVKSKLPSAATKVTYSNIEAFLKAIAVHAGDVIIPGLIYQDIVVSPQAQSFFDPTHRYAWVVRGLLGTMLNNRIFTDCFMKADDAERVFSNNERAFYLVHRNDAALVR